MDWRPQSVTTRRIAGRGGPAFAATMGFDRSRCRGQPGDETPARPRPESTRAATEAICTPCASSAFARAGALEEQAVEGGVPGERKRVERESDRASVGDVKEHGVVMTSTSMRVPRTT